MASFIPAEVIKKKRNNQPLRFEEIQTFVNTYVEKKIPDYQMSALLMAIFFNGLNREEMSHLTQIMRDSGYKFTFDGLHCVDK
ncbi:MAG: thymidine phosphorylase, partial [Bdellovibrionales bacterium]|nr:thymidine phosphorylase [Bdellovibrionales bacterium]